MEILVWCYIIGIILIGTLLAWLLIEKWMWLVAAGVVVAGIAIWRKAYVASCKSSIRRVEIVDDYIGSTTFRVWREGRAPELRTYAKGSEKHDELMRMM